MRTIRILTLGLILVVSATSHQAVAVNTADLMQQALYAEEVEGNIEAAIQRYGGVLQNHPTTKQAAQALYRQALCYLKMKDEASARRVLEKLVSDYPGETELIARAQPILDELADFDPAALMPPDTLVYLELGSPGKQVETLLAMLKGTPFEDPIAMISGGKADKAARKSPGDMIGALLNPGTLAEFKKIRSSAVGIIGIGKHHPQLIAALYPGKSDALRGLMLAGIGVAGTPGESIAGMQRVNLPDDLAVAYDDKIIIMARPAQRLEWSVRQYKKINSDQTLASSNNSFGRLDKSQRDRNVVTVWVNVEQAYQQFMPMLPKELLAANVFIDFANISDFVLTQTIESNGISARAELQLREGHHFLAYDLIRTPNLNKAAFQAVPAQAVGVASVALGTETTVQASQLRTQIETLTGLDLGRELFANLEQITLFALPADEKSSDEFLPAHFGLAITSRNPEKTRQVLSTVLGVLNATNPGRTNPPPGQYKIGQNGKRELYCFLEQTNGVTFLSLNRDVMDASIMAIKKHQSAFNSGTLRDAINSLNPSASKAVLWNEGGMMRLIGPLMIPKGITGDSAMLLNTNVCRLQTSLDGTTIALTTDETPNSFRLNANVTGLPPLNEIFEPAMQIAQIVKQAKPVIKANVKSRERPRSVSIFSVTNAPVIDGNEDEMWRHVPRQKLEKTIMAFGSGESPSRPTSPADLSADFRATWDQNNLYVLVDVVDDQLVSDTDPINPVTLPSGSQSIPWWYDDSIEIFLDADNAKTEQYGPHDAQFRFNLGPQPTVRAYNQNNPIQVEGIAFAMRQTTNGYRLEASFPWKSFAVKPSAGASVGFDVHVNDDDDGGARDSQIAWNDKNDAAWETPQAFGTIVLRAAEKEINPQP